MNIKNSEIYQDPFDEPLEDRLIFNDTYFEAARNAVTVDGMEFSFLKPPYMNFDDHVRTKRKLREAYSQHEFLLFIWILRLRENNGTHPVS